jgi:ribosomal protein L5
VANKERKNYKKMQRFYSNRDLLLQNSFDQSMLNFVQKSVCHLNTNLNRGIESKKDLGAAGYFLEIIAAQKPVPIRAKKSSAIHKNRKSELFGWQVTLRKKNYESFLKKWKTYSIVQETTSVKISNLSSLIEFHDAIIPTNLKIHIQCKT